MTREEAIKILKAIRVYECYPKSASEETKEAIDMAIEALNSVTDSENGAVESKNDVIKRQDAIKTVIRMCSPICDWELEKKAYTDCVIDEINSLPSAEPKTGEWDLCKDDDGVYGVCSICGCYVDFSLYGRPYKVCPHCGARMKGGDSE